MKKLVAIIGVLAVLFVGGIAFLATFDINRLGKEHLYVQIGEPHHLEETKLNSGEIDTRYWYELPAYDKDGKQTMTSFSAAKKLKVDGYLKLYTKKSGSVTSYDGVTWGEIPRQAQDKLKSAN
ncbi:hypothetical protein PA598K_03306 [Paenibacillus sp. 598K]|uniref:YxeA family protein n=1 Tax=Paenibacillus sp. 598K TaxID=1117987 RepID=UPI000FF96C3B|nr:YxeA family protein [Paenibacillus sp. 598K]GBF74933.1 hypothetical protein PA598K_03306 [Paenibacillus sp. 598K]